MPKAVLTFQLPEEQEEFEDAQNGASYRRCIQYIDDKLRKMYKYKNLTQVSVIRVRHLINEVMEKRGLILYG